MTERRTAAPTPPLEGRIALVTGANHGIGAATCVALARLGADVLVSYLALTPTGDPSDEPSAYDAQRAQHPGAVVEAVERLGRRAHVVEADLADETAAAALFAAAESNLGPASILVNNASAWHADTFTPDATDAVGRTSDPVTAQSVMPQFLVDVRAAALLIAELAASVRRNGLAWGRVISLTSGGTGGFPGEVSYGAAKAALENYTMSASVELADDGITANVVYPPVTDTGWVTDDVRAFVARSSDHVHVAEASEVAEVIGWLCTGAARLITGNVIRLR